MAAKRVTKTCKNCQHYNKWYNLCFHAQRVNYWNFREKKQIKRSCKGFAKREDL